MFDYENQSPKEKIKRTRADTIAKQIIIIK
jgi:hypothetical protein